MGKRAHSLLDTDDNNFDQAFLDTVPLGALREFRDMVSYPLLGLKYNLRCSEQLFPPKFVQENPEAFQGTDWVHIDQLRAFMTSHGHRRSFPFVIRSSSPSLSAADSSRVKHEEPDIDLAHSSPLPSPRTQTLKIGGNEVIEILSSDSEGEVEVRSGLEDFSDTKFLECNPTDWQDNAVASHVVYNGDPVPVTRQLKVEHIEILVAVRTRLIFISI